MQLLEFAMSFPTDDNSIPEGGYIRRYEKALDEAASLAGLHDSSTHLKSYLQDAGFIDVKVVIKKLPVGVWPKDPKQKVSLMI